MIQGHVPAAALFCPGECPGLHLFPVDKKPAGPAFPHPAPAPSVNPMPFYTVLPFLYMLYIRG